MSLDSELADRFARERRRTASILRDAAEYAVGRQLRADELLMIAARHIELGDDYGTLWGECKRCRNDEGGAMRTEMPFGREEWICCECERMILPVEAIR